MAKLGNNAVRDEFGLNPQEREFADTYLITLNGTESILAVKPNMYKSVVEEIKEELEYEGPIYHTTSHSSKYKKDYPIATF